MVPPNPGLFDGTNAYDASQSLQGSRGTGRVVGKDGAGGGLEIHGDGSDAETGDEDVWTGWAAEVVHCMLTRFQCQLWDTKFQI